MTRVMIRQKLFVLLFLFTSVFVALAPAYPAFADPPTADEQLATSRWPNWVGLCGTVTPGDLGNQKSAKTGPVYIMGDSITELAQGSYKSVFEKGGWSPTVEGLSSRQITTTPPSPSGLGQLDRDKDKIGNAHAIVIALGTNGVTNSESSTKSAVESAMKKVKKYNTSDAPVYWVNVIDTHFDAASKRTNKGIKEGVGNDATVIDWYGAAKDKADLNSFNEGVHPTKASDIKLLTNLVYDAVSGGASGGDSRNPASATAKAASAKKGVKFTTGMTIDTDGIGSGGDSSHQTQTSYANGKLNADNTSYIALAPGWSSARNLVLGDVALVEYKGKTAYAIYGDNYSGNQVHGEGSVHLAKALGIPASGVSGGVSSGVKYTVYPNSHKKTNGTVDQKIIDEVGQEFSGGAPSASAASDTSKEKQVQCCPTGGSAETVSAGTGTPEGTTFPNLDPAKMASAIDAWIAKANPNSKMKGLGATIVASAKHSDINPFLFPAIARKESSLADPNDFNTKNANNAFGRTAAPGQPSFQGARPWYKWSSVKASLDYAAAENKAHDGGDMASYIKAVYPDAIKNGDFTALMMKYAPPGENDTATYISELKTWIKELVALSGDSGGGSAGAGAAASDPSSTDSSSSSACCPPADSGATASDASNPSSTDKPNFVNMTSGSGFMGHGSMKKPDALVIHYVQGNQEGGALRSFFKGQGKGYGVQFNIGKTGKVYQYFPLDSMQESWHVGEINNHAIGIEITGADGEALMNNDKQFQSVVSTAKYLCDYYKMPCSQPKGDITGASPAEAQGLLGHSEAPNPGCADCRHSDPDTKISYKGGSEIDTNIVTGKGWTDNDRKDSSKHAYMMKLRKALGYNATPGSGKDSGPVASDAGKCPAATAAAASEDANLKKTITVKTPGKFINMPKAYTCPGHETNIDSRVAADLAYLATKYDMCTEDGRANGHKSHGAGISVDMIPRKGSSKEAWKNSTEAAARAIGWYGDGASDSKGSKPSCANYAGGDYGQCMHEVHPDKFPVWMRWMGYNGAFDHGDPWHVYGGAGAHIHISWDTPAHSDATSEGMIPSPVKAVYVFPAPIPDDLKKLVD